MSITRKYRPEKQEVRKAEQNHAALVSTRAIVQRYCAGDPRVLNEIKEARFEDQTQQLSRGDMLNAVADARSAYERLPPAIKSRFGSYLQLVRYLNNPANRAEAERIGLCQKPEAVPIPATDKLLSEIRDRLPLPPKGANE